MFECPYDDTDALKIFGTKGGGGTMYVCSLLCVVDMKEGLKNGPGA